MAKRTLCRVVCVREILLFPGFPMLVVARLWILGFEKSWLKIPHLTFMEVMRTN